MAENRFEERHRKRVSEGFVVSRRSPCQMLAEHGTIGLRSVDKTISGMALPRIRSDKADSRSPPVAAGSRWTPKPPARPAHRLCPDVNLHKTAFSCSPRQNREEFHAFARAPTSLTCFELKAHASAQTAPMTQNTGARKGDRNARAANTLPPSHAPKRFKPDSAPVCAPSMPPSNRTSAPARSIPVISADPSVRVAIQGARTKSVAAIVPLASNAVKLDNAMIRPALDGSSVRNSATCFAAVKPMPNRKPRTFPQCFESSLAARNRAAKCRTRCRNSRSSRGQRIQPHIPTAIDQRRPSGDVDRFVSATKDGQKISNADPRLCHDARPARCLPAISVPNFSAHTAYQSLYLYCKPITVSVVQLLMCLPTVNPSIAVLSSIDQACESVIVRRRDNFHIWQFTLRLQRAGHMHALVTSKSRLIQLPYQRGLLAAFSRVFTRWLPTRIRMADTTSDFQHRSHVFASETRHATLAAPELKINRAFLVGKFRTVQDAVPRVADLTLRRGHPSARSPSKDHEGRPPAVWG